MRCPSWCCSWTFNGLLSYSTVKIVQIKDWRLGLLHYLFMLVVVGYIVGYIILYQKRYLALEAPVGSVRTSLQSMQTKGLVPNPANELEYCLQKQPSYRGFPNLECIYYDEDLVVYPEEEATGMFITTRITESVESTGGCDLRNNTCKFRTLPNTTFDYYIACIENFTVLIDHSMYAERLGIKANSEELPGKLNDQDGDEMSIPAGNYVGRAGYPDIMNVSLLLKAAGIDSLDQISVHDKSRTMRDDGIVLLVFITYSNTYTYDTDKIEYTYDVKLQTDTKFKVVEPVLKNSTNLVIWNRHGIRLLFIQTGALGRFDFQTMLLSFVSGLGLLAISTLIVDIIALRLLPQTSKMYRHYKYEETPEEIGGEIVDESTPINKDK